jgi:chemotaxis protein MotB
MRRKRYIIENNENEDLNRWLISYADFITLLFAFFVVLYSISQVDQNKYKYLSESLEGVFQNHSMDIIPNLNENTSQKKNTHTSLNDSETKKIKNEASIHQSSENKIPLKTFNQLKKDIKNSLKALIDQQLSQVNSDEEWIHIVLKSMLLFPSGSDEMKVGIDLLLKQLAHHLNQNNLMILIHGHTDNIPIDTENFPSNWELSSARAVAVLRMLEKFNISPARLSIQGHAEYSPVASNQTAIGRQENRRVVISISRISQVSLNNQQTLKNTSLRMNNEFKKTAKEKIKEKPYKIIKLPTGGILIRAKQEK